MDFMDGMDRNKRLLALVHSVHTVHSSCQRLADSNGRYEFRLLFVARPFPARLVHGPCAFGHRPFAACLAGAGWPARTAFVGIQPDYPTLAQFGVFVAAVFAALDGQLYGWSAWRTARTRPAGSCSTGTARARTAWPCSTMGRPLGSALVHT